MRENPPPSSEAARNRMKAARQRNTAAELALRSELHKRGLRYRVDVRPLEELHRRADIVFRKAEVAVFVDGCFWHGCPVHGTWPKANAEFWRKKIEGNRERDSETNQYLKAAGWIVVRIWEHENPVEASKMIAKILQRR